MQMKLLKSIALVGIVSFFCACSGSKKSAKTETKEETVVAPAAPAVNAPVLQVDPHLQNGKTINLKVNEKFDVVFLRECIGCAEVWRITNIDKDKLTQMESTYRNGPASGVNGGSQDHIFHFTAKDKGTTTLTFVYFKDTRSITFQIN
jgi:predicted secreted protein